ncbi:putative 26S Proteasome non-ATPase regulatory subunit 13 [Helianthus annuus]|uniref:26S Proteasome non-ATPase regulatory subunit 13 n=1 Tax=Helianthus annuus TaxID=4232 RepID=A0A9K3NXB0_HELAN|nr:putative 26S Proteasome non-ATPase regulatory subunit 13 [Helianthus annuus]KAJ0593386.1 putative 26S Proteasome non-ATPase regulatory subunit 13 [Helianthus annuus]KAJ0601252.1 putative 26S Proteasome non-ATPase regulatory subunit 13 [Helianthus annuus]KAJ0608396.1 putative 26S Proteasome non-ATPase regulatory subunit 13 [Helianthus annuus]KAJ0629615.1 putative 26S Proteasome non-ATPase regulatory subunit 13 [Helianthus annuus]
MANIDPSVCTQFYWASVLYHKYQKEYFECYMNVMLFLAYASEESMSHSFKLDLAYCVSVFALLGENIDNFGELLAHPIVGHCSLVLCSVSYNILFISIVVK